MALLRALEIPNRLHGFTIDKKLQAGAIKGIWYRLAPARILHSWVEVWEKGNWYFLEGVIIDSMYLSALQNVFSENNKSFCGYGVCTSNMANPPIDWNYNHTFIQKGGIVEDFGLFATPDEFYRKHRQGLNFVKRLVFKHWVRHHMNRNVARIRDKRKG